MSLRPPLLAGICITATVTLVGTVYAMTKPQLAQPAPALQAIQLGSPQSCQAQANDPQPPLNIRSTPDDASNNIVGTVPNGTVLTVVNSHRKWVRVSQPIAGWVYEDLIRPSCSQTATLPQQSKLSRRSSATGEQILQVAMRRYHAGQLAAAMAQLQTVPSHSTAYRQAQLALKTLPAEWQRAERQYHQAELAYKAGKWQDVIGLVQEFPDIRVWREKLTPIVKQAIANQKKVMTTAHSQSN
jgi:Bacterial SH3 domain